MYKNKDKIKHVDLALLTSEIKHKKNYLKKNIHIIKGITSLENNKSESELAN